ncbi:g11943 [Coccomyxa viridis]|uniref:G11943 protein n=1 Tax=Coccomyxa viridis TaxID=1274662 RepID=A0ABP1G945_9CHLO
MGLQGYVGSAEDQRRIRRQEKEREERKRQFEDKKKQSDANVDAAGLRQFGTGTSELDEQAFKDSTVGLVTRDKFLHMKNTIQERREEEAAQAKREAEQQQEQGKKLRQQKKAKLAARTKLSFAQEEDEEEDTEQNGSAKEHKEEQDAAEERDDEEREQLRLKKLGKDPTARTDFLPDKEREAEEGAVRAQLKKEYELRQKLLKNETLKITYSYWDGQGHRRLATVKKGDTVKDFLQKVKEQLIPEFRELRTTSVSTLMYVKEDLIIPHHFSFYDLISTKARGKSGPLFHFDVHEDIRTQHDARIEKDESHAGKVVDRHWYNRNKHIFPASRWETYDPDKVFEMYTTHGSEVKIWNGIM